VLFTDSDIITTTDLQAADAECVKVASSENPAIALSGSGSIIQKSIEECGHQVRAQFQNFSGYLVSPGINLNHVAAVLNILSTAINRPRMRLNQVVALDPDPTKCLFKRWLVYYALFQLYRDAYARFSRNTDRFERKMNLYDDEANKAWKRLISDGVPVVLQPLACPGAIREFGAGTFGSGNVSAGGTGSTETGHTYTVAITWVAQPAYVSQTNKGNAESAGSATVQVSPTSGQVITVNINGLTAPGATIPAIGTADGLYTPLVASGWNVYVSLDQANWYLQNATPIPLATTSYTLANAPVLSGYTLQPGQFADYNFAFQNVLFRA
jgi:hypothetical protein